MYVYGLIYILYKIRAKQFAQLRKYKIFVHQIFCYERQSVLIKHFTYNSPVLGILDRAPFPLVKQFSTANIFINFKLKYI